MIQTGSDLRTWRKSNGLKQSELASLLDVRQATISAWEHKEKLPKTIGMAIQSIYKLEHGFCRISTNHVKHLEVLK